MDFMIELIQLVLIVLIGVAFFNTSSMIERAKKYDDTHEGIAQVILGLDKVLHSIQDRLSFTNERLDELEKRVSVIDPNGGKE